MSLQGTQTEKNLLKAFAGESQARNRYTFFAEQARKEGLVQIAAIFEETANQETEHAKRFFKFLKGGEVEITAKFPAGTIATTGENLKRAAEGEHCEWSELYPAFAKTARQEGFEAVAKVFEAVSVAEKGHEERYKAFGDMIDGNEVFSRSEKVQWRCRTCGYLHEGPEAPAACPACAQSKEVFEVKLGWL